MTSARDPKHVLFDLANRYWGIGGSGGIGGIGNIGALEILGQSQLMNTNIGTKSTDEYIQQGYQPIGALGVLGSHPVNKS